MPPSKVIGDLNFTKVLDELKKLHKEYPTIRIGAMLQASLDLKKRKDNANLNDVSTKELLTGVKNYRTMLKENKRKKR